jgi:hypothetical protein
VFVSENRDTCAYSSHVPPSGAFYTAIPDFEDYYCVNYRPGDELPENVVVALDSADVHTLAYDTYRLSPDN